VEVVWTATALADIASIFGYVRRFNPHVATRLVSILRQTGDSLATFPERGRLTGAGRRELLIVRPYVIRYRIDGSRVLILRIRHGHQEPE